jgi:hypothetical protein
VLRRQEESERGRAALITFPRHFITLNACAAPAIFPRIGMRKSGKKRQVGTRRSFTRPSIFSHLFRCFSLSCSPYSVQSGIYYPPDSLKTALCIRGRDLLYSRCRKKNIAFKQTGKLVLATDQSQVPYLKQLHERSKLLRDQKIGDVPLEWLTGAEVRQLEPDVGEKVVGALLSPKTGIVSSHELMDDLEKGAYSLPHPRIWFLARISMPFLLSVADPPAHSPRTSQRLSTARTESWSTVLASSG